MRDIKQLTIRFSALWSRTRFFLFPCVLALSLGRCAYAQDNALTFDDLVRSAEQWAKENLDEDALRVLQNTDREKVERLLAGIQKQFQGEYVIDLASLKEGARNLLRLLEQ